MEFYVLSYDFLEHETLTISAYCQEQFTGIRNNMINTEELDTEKCYINVNSMHYRSPTMTEAH